MTINAMTDSKPNNDTVLPAPTMAESKPENPFVFDTGNIRILVTQNSQRVEGKASSDALCLASPVWKKFLFPPWQAENAIEKVEQIDFTEDDSAALAILLNIAHLKFHMVPAWLPYQLLLQVAVLCDQYDCVNLVLPWLLDTRWLKGESVESLKLGQHKWLFISWVFEREQVFENLAKSLVKTISVTGNGELWKDETPMPPLIMGSILSCRRTLIASLLKIPYDLLSKYEAGDLSVICCLHKLEACDVLTYGSILRNLRRYNLFPRLQPEEIYISAEELASNLNGVAIHQLPEMAGRYRFSHGGCCVKDFKHEVHEELAMTIDPLLISHRDHFKARK
ncbi:hypothetical protein EG329_011014 [Mollisiaceae sp. DMI_Dod_QoI]|nr:hypothetical protein EG329_011014 [Helotiales sp. DMI_Dod_QoI]